MPPKQTRRTGRRSRRAGGQANNAAYGTAAGEQGARVPTLAKALFGQGMPDEIHTTLKYGLHSTTATGTSFAISALAANDVRDPGVATAATADNGYAGFIANYAQFYVLASRIRVRCTHASTASGIGSTAVASTVGVFPSAGATVANDRSSAEAQPGCKQVTFDIGGMKTLEQHCSNPRVQGVTKQQYIADATNWGASSASPADAVYWNIWSQSSAAQTSVNIELDIQLEHDVVFFRRRSLDLAFERELLKLVLARDARESALRDEFKKRLTEGGGFTLEAPSELNVEHKTLPALKFVLPDSSAREQGWFKVRQQEPPTPGKLNKTGQGPPSLEQLKR